MNERRLNWLLAGFLFFWFALWGMLHFELLLLRDEIRGLASELERHEAKRTGLAAK